MDVLVTLSNGADVLVTQAQIGRGPEAHIEGRVHGSGDVRFPKAEALSVQLVENGHGLGRRHRVARRERRDRRR